MISLIFAAQLIQPASASVELTLSVDGSSEVPAQGYQVNAMVMRTGPAEEVSSDSRRLLAELEELETENRDLCRSFSYPMGFMANEYYDEPVEEMVPEEEAEAPEASADVEESVVPSPFGFPLYYSGLFSTREAADQALGLLRPRKPNMLISVPVLYDCDEALKQAKVDALRRSQEQAEALAEAMGMKVAGVVKIDDDDAQATVESLLSYYSGESDSSDRTVSTKVRLRVTFNLVK